MLGDGDAAVADGVSPGIGIGSVGVHASEANHSEMFCASLSTAFFRDVLSGSKAAALDEVIYDT